jgi:SAM-dependent methyltransferase
MRSEIAAKLIELNREFYQTFGRAFSEKRQRLQPGVRRVLDSLSGLESILDLGCGNGEVGRELARRGHRGPYLGLDFSLPLLTEAERQSNGLTVNFAQADLTSDNWDASLSTFHSPLPTSHFSLITAFAVLHHIPSESLRVNILNKVHALLAPDGKFILSNWQFLNSDKWRKRLQPWERIGLSSCDVDAGDYLLDWRHGGEGLRYVHCFSEEELAALAFQSGFTIQDTFHADGEGGRLSLYQICGAR